MHHQTAHADSNPILIVAALIACACAEPLGNQPLKLTSHKKIDDQAAQRKTEESSERSSGALLGGYREVLLLT